VVSGVGFLVGYIGYGASTGNWGGKAFAAGGIGAAVAEGSYLTLGGGAVAIGSETANGSVLTEAAASENASLFAGNYAVNAGLNIAQHSGQISSSSGWAGVALVGGYSFSAGVLTGFTTGGDWGAETRIDQHFNIKDGLGSGAVSDAIGGGVNNGITSVFEGYNPETNKWDVKWNNVLNESWKGAVAFGGQKLIGNAFDKLIDKVPADAAWKSSLFFGKNAVSNSGNQMIINLLHGKSTFHGIFDYPNVIGSAGGGYSDMMTNVLSIKKF
jgi:hypothetical protein